MERIDIYSLKPGDHLRFSYGNTDYKVFICVAPKAKSSDGEPLIVVRNPGSRLKQRVSAQYVVEVIRQRTMPCCEYGSMRPQDDGSIEFFDCELHRKTPPPAERKNR